MAANTHISFRSFLVFSALAAQLGAQVYNYEPIRYASFESNPAYLASAKNKCVVSLSQQGLPLSNRFYSSQLRFSFFSAARFTGLGITAGHTQVSDSAAYSYAGLGLGYRTVLFNKVFTRIGLLYKFVHTLSPGGNFTYYGFRRTGETGRQQQVLGNANLSVSLTSAGERKYLSLGVLNAAFSWQGKGSHEFFPVYYVLHAGDLARILHLVRWEISYTAFARQYQHQARAPFSHYITVVYNGLVLTRYKNLRMGARVGETDKAFLQCHPMLGIYRRLRHRARSQKGATCQLIGDFGIRASGKLAYRPGLQFNLTYHY